MKDLHEVLTSLPKELTRLNQDNVLTKKELYDKLYSFIGVSIN